MRQETAVDGFRLAYERLGPGPGTRAVLMLHGWPGDRIGECFAAATLTWLDDVGHFSPVEAPDAYAAAITAALA